MNTRDIRTVPLNTSTNGQFFFNNRLSFFYSEDGMRYHVDNVSLNHNVFTLRNSRTGSSRIVTLTELEEGRYRDSYFFQYE